MVGGSGAVQTITRSTHESAVQAAHAHGAPQGFIRNGPSASTINHRASVYILALPLFVGGFYRRMRHPLDLADGSAAVICEISR